MPLKDAQYSYFPGTFSCVISHHLLSSNLQPHSKLIISLLISLRKSKQQANFYKLLSHLPLSTYTHIFYLSSCDYLCSQLSPTTPLVPQIPYASIAKGFSPPILSSFPSLFIPISMQHAIILCILKNKTHNPLLDCTSPSS